MLVGIVVALAATGGIAVGGYTLYWGDVLLYFEPLAEFMRSEIRAGRLPLWSPYILCGQPIVGNPQSMVFYPTTALLPALTAVQHLGLTSAIAIVIAYSGMYRYLRCLGLQRLPSAFGACTWAGSFAVLGRLQFPTMLHAIAWMPWVLWATVRCAAHPSALRSAALGVVVALSLMSGHPQVSYMTFMAAAAHLLMLPAVVPAASPRRSSSALGLVAGSCLGLALAAPYWLPVVQMLGHSSRAELALDMANRFVLLPEQLLGFVAPNYFGSPGTGDYWGAGNMWEPAVYIGLPQLALAAYAVVARPRSACVRFHVLMATFWLWLALGAYAGLFALVYHAVPGMSGFHDPARFAIPAVLSLAALSAFGVQRTKIASPGLRWLLAASVVLLLAAGARLTPTVERSELGYRPRALAVTSQERRIYTAERQDVWDRYVNYADYGPESGRYVHELTDTLAPNIGMRYGLEEAGGYEPVPLERAATIEAVVRGRVLRQDPGLARATSLVDAGHVIWPLYTRIQHPALQVVRASGLAGYATRSEGARAWVVQDVIAVPDLQRARAALSSPHFDARTTAVVVTDRRSGAVVRRHGAGPSTRVIAKTATSIRIDLREHRSDGLLVVCNAAYPGWRALVDGRRAEAHTVDAGLLGVEAPRGTRHIALDYRPFVVRLGIFVGLLGLIALCTILASTSRLRATNRAGRYTNASSY